MLQESKRIKLKGAFQIIHTLCNFRHHLINLAFLLVSNTTKYDQKWDFPCYNIPYHVVHKLGLHCGKRQHNRPWENRVALTKTTTEWALGKPWYNMPCINSGCIEENDNWIALGKAMIQYAVHKLELHWRKQQLNRPWESHDRDYAVHKLGLHWGKWQLNRPWESHDTICRALTRVALRKTTTESPLGKPWYNILCINSGWIEEHDNWMGPWKANLASRF